MANRLPLVIVSGQLEQIQAGDTLSVPALSASGTVTGSNLSGTNTGDQLVFKTISVSGQSDVVADTATDTLTLVGSGVTITTNAATDTITFTAAGGTGTVTSVEVTTANGLLVSGGTDQTITTSGTFALTLPSFTCTAASSITVTDGLTSSISSGGYVCHSLSVGTALNGFGVSWDFRADSTTTAAQLMGGVHYYYVDPTHATRRSIGYLTVVLASGGVGIEYVPFAWSVDASGNTLLAFHSGTAVAKQSGDVGTALVTYNLMSGTPTFAAANLTGTALPSGLVAAQSDQETATSTVLAVTPGRQQYHPSAAKAWVEFDASSGTPTILVSYNVSSLTDNGVGDTTINFTTAFSTANYTWHYGGSTLTNDSRFGWNTTTAPAAGSFRLGTANSSQALSDGKRSSITFFGDQ